MEVAGSEIGQKMRSAIKAKLTELGCYVDDELPDYVMVMVANKRTRAQMEDDLQLFLGENTELFVNWLHQVLKKLQEVTITTPTKPIVEQEKNKDKIKEKKSKVKKIKNKLKKMEGVKKAKKKDKEKTHRKKEDKKKAHKSKKKSKHHEGIRPNVPPFLMNMEKESEPSITDVFAGQILKNHGINLDIPTAQAKHIDKKPIVEELKRPIMQIIDPATISTQPEPNTTNVENEPITEVEEDSSDVLLLAAPREEQIKEINEIEAKIQGLKQKLAEQLDSMSDDEDFLNIRTEAEELMNDFAEDVFQEISSQTPVAVATPPPLIPAIKKSPSPVKTVIKPIEMPKPIPEPDLTPDTLPQIELKLPKRPVRERLGAKEEVKKTPEVEKEVDIRTESPERFTPDRDPDFWPKSKSAKSRLGDPPELPKRPSISDDSSDKSDASSKKLTSKVSSLGVSGEGPRRSGCASVVRVRPRPRPRGALASNLLLRAVAEAHKSLLTIPPKVETEPQKVKRALVLPMRRGVDSQKILIQVPCGERLDRGSGDIDDNAKVISDTCKEEYVPISITKQIQNSDYVPSRRSERSSSRRDDTLIIETLNIHNTTVGKDKDTQFIVTMDGFNPNSFLAKKLITEGILNGDDETKESIDSTKESIDSNKESIDSNKESTGSSKESMASTIAEIKSLEAKDSSDSKDTKDKELSEKESDESSDEEAKTKVVQRKRLSNTSEESNTQVIIKQDDEEVEKSLALVTVTEEPPPVKRRRASPIVFDMRPKVNTKEKETQKEPEKERTESVSSDSNVVTTVPNTHKYDSLPPLSMAVPERKPTWCRAFPLCRYGAACAFQHPRCKFAAACTRRGCTYGHPPARTPPPALASHVVPVANFKSISPNALPSVCKYYPNCANPSCHYYHPKPCRYGKACVNKLECNFYHNDVPGAKWRYAV